MIADHLDESADVWLLPEEAVHRTVARVGGLSALSDEERERLAGIEEPGPRTRFLGGRVLLRYVLAAYSSLPPDRIRFVAGQYGRLELAYPDIGLRFNLSHTDGLVGCIVTRDRMCGMDIECLPPAEDVIRTVVQFLAPSEQETVRGASDAGLAALELWVVKEAYLKALGVGLNRPLDSFRVHTAQEGTRVLHDPSTYGIGWQLDVTQLGDSHLVAFALATEEGAAQPIPIRLLDLPTFLEDAYPTSSPGGHDQLRPPYPPYPIEKRT